MRLLQNILGGAMLVAVGLVATPAPVFAQANVTVSQGYSSILQQGIIFANICVDENGAQQLPPSETGTADACQCRAQGICSLAQVIQLFINIIILLLGISGSVALAMFVYAGWLWVFAQGRPDQIQAGKDTMKNASIGLAIIFGAYAAINFAIAFLGGIDPGTSIEDTINALPATKANGETVELNADDVLNTTTQ